MNIRELDPIERRPTTKGVMAEVDEDGELQEALQNIEVKIEVDEDVELQEAIKSIEEKVTVEYHRWIPSPPYTGEHLCTHFLDEERNARECSDIEETHVNAANHENDELSLWNTSQEGQEMTYEVQIPETMTIYQPNPQTMQEEAERGSRGRQMLIDLAQQRQREQKEKDKERRSERDKERRRQKKLYIEQIERRLELLERQNRIFRTTVARQMKRSLQAKAKRHQETTHATVYRLQQCNEMVIMPTLEGMLALSEKENLRKEAERHRLKADRGKKSELALIKELWYHYTVYHPNQIRENKIKEHQLQENFN